MRSQALGIGILVNVELIVQFGLRIPCKFFRVECLEDRNPPLLLRTFVIVAELIVGVVSVVHHVRTQPLRQPLRLLQDDVID